MVIPPSAHAGTLCQSLAPWKWLYHLQPTEAPYAKDWHHGNGYTTFSPRRHPMPNLAPWKWLYHLQPTQAPNAKVWHYRKNSCTLSPNRHSMTYSGIEKGSSILYKAQDLPTIILNMTENFSPKALVVVERLLELLG